MKRLFNIVMLLALFAVSGCRREPLHDLYAKALLELDIDLDIVNRPGYPAPETMLVLFYNPETGELVSRDYVAPTGGELAVSPGDYDMFVYNFDTGHTEIGNINDFYRIEAGIHENESYLDKLFRSILDLYAKRASTGAADAGRSSAPQHVMHEPDHLFLADSQQVHIPVTVDVEIPAIIRMHARSIVQSWRLVIGPVNGSQHFKSAEVFLTGQTYAHRFHDGAETNGEAVIHFPIYLDSGSKDLTTVFNTFHKYPGAVAEVYLLVTDTSGRRFAYRYDVTGQFDDPLNTEQLIVIREQIDIPEPSSGEGGGFDNEVNPYEDHIFDINI